MKTHVIYIETPDDVSGQDVVMAIEGAFEYALDDYSECIKTGVDKEDEASYKRRIDMLESIHILEDEPIQPERPHSATIACPACNSPSRRKLQDHPHWDYECQACNACYTGLTLSDQRRIAKKKAPKDITVSDSMIMDETQRAKQQASNEKHYADILDRLLTKEQKDDLTDTEENGNGNAYGVTKDPVKGHKKRAVQANKRRGYIHTGKTKRKKK